MNWKIQGTQFFDFDPYPNWPQQVVASCCAPRYDCRSCQKFDRSFHIFSLPTCPSHVFYLRNWYPQQQKIARKSDSSPKYLSNFNLGTQAGLHTGTNAQSRNHPQPTPHTPRTTWNNPGTHTGSFWSAKQVSAMNNLETQAFHIMQERTRWARCGWGRIETLELESMKVPFSLTFEVCFQPIHGFKRHGTYFDWTVPELVAHLHPGFLWQRPEFDAYGII